jgi:hypothetical protein
MKTLVFALILTVSFSSIGFSQERKLDLAKESLKQKEIVSASSSSGSVKNPKTKVKNPFIEELGLLIFKISIGLAYQISVESYLEKDSKMHKASLSKYPYKEKYFGNYIYTDSTKNKSVFRVDVMSSFVYESKILYGNNLNFNFRFAKRFDLELGSLQLFEKVDGSTDNFSLYNAMINYHRIRSQKLDFWFGFGIMYVANDVEKAGFSYGVGAEWFFSKPMSVLATYKGTSINSRTVDKARFLLKYHIKNFNISTGFEHYTLGVSNVNTFSVGVGVSF